MSENRICRVAPTLITTTALDDHPLEREVREGIRDRPGSTR